MNISVVDVYVINIMPQQITKRLHCLPTETDKIQQERENFRKFLLSSFEMGRFFFSQLDAWMAYNFQSEMDRLFEEASLEQLTDSETNWMNEIEAIIFNKIKPTNYNEFGGQE